MSGVDWSASPVGDPATWPELLRSMVRVMAASRFSMWLGWGPELAFFYNDAYARNTLGVKHPWALGRPAAEVWSEIWAEIQPRADAVLGAGETTWDEALLLFLERSGYREETYHTFSYSPITDAAGRIHGLLCVVSEETSRVIAERRMETIRDLASGVSAAWTEDSVFEAVRAALSGNPKDLPFTLTYVRDRAGEARLGCSTGIPAGHPAALSGSDPAAWPLGEVLTSGRPRVVDDLGTLFQDLPCGAWPEAPRQAILLPLSEAGTAEPTGVFIAGLNPYRLLDPAYRGFAELISAGISSGLAGARAYEAERRRAEALAELDRAKTEFFSNVSHELRTPLTLIGAPADDALNDDLHPLPQVQRGRLELIQRNARRLRRLVNDMLDFARIEGGRLQAETVPTDLTRFTGDLALSFAPAIERAGLELLLDLRPLDREVSVDRDMWEKIVLNLLSNALKFTLQGSIRLGISGDAEQVRLSVSDTGVGIGADQLPHLFERFYRVPRSAARSHEGTGIGLALVAELARLHGGEVSVESSEGLGSTFEVRIPYGEPSSVGGGAQRQSSLVTYLDEALQWSETGGASPVSAVDAVAGQTADATILVVDDNPDMRAYLGRMLGPFWGVRTAANGEEALAMVAGERPDLILADVMMPRLDGFALLGRVRSDPATATIPVVLLSARAGEEAAVEGLQAGADDYLVKPFSGLELLARVRSNLELARLRSRDAAWRAALVDSLQDAVVVLDGAGSLTEANAAFEQVLGYPRSGLPYGPPFPWVFDSRSDPDASAAAGDIHRRIMAGERVNATVPLRHRLGHKLHVSVRSSSLGAADERRVIVAFNDVTAEITAGERDAALGRLGVRLAESGATEEVIEAGLTELRQAYGGRRASLLAWHGDVGVEEAAQGGQASPDGPSPTDVLSGAVRGHPVVLPPAGAAEPDLVASVGAVIDPREDRRLVWLELDPPRRMPAEERSLLTVLCGYFGQALRRAQLFDDNRAVATAMQRAILGPTEVPAGMAVCYLPAVQPLEVGGDWYDVVALEDGRMAVVVGDCTGRGLEAATTMGQLRSACRALLLQAKGPAEVVSALDAFAEHLPGAECTTVFCVLLDHEQDRLCYSSAGHLPAVLAAAGGPAVLLDQAQGLPLGLGVPGPRPQAEVAMVPGSTLVLYTDGLVERRGESLDLGLGRLCAAVADHRGDDPVAMVDELIGGLAPAGSQRDDIAVVVYRRPQPGLEVSLRTDPNELSSMRHRLQDWLEAAGVDSAAVTDLLIATGEACANAIEHAYRFAPDRTVHIGARISGDVVEVSVADDGSWWAGAGDSDRGRGIDIMRALMDDVAVDRGPHGTTVRMRKGIKGVSS